MRRKCCLRSSLDEGVFSLTQCLIHYTFARLGGLPGRREECFVSMRGSRFRLQRRCNATLILFSTATFVTLIVAMGGHCLKHLNVVYSARTEVSQPKCDTLQIMLLAQGSQETIWCEGVDRARSGALTSSNSMCPSVTALRRHASR